MRERTTILTGIHADHGGHSHAGHHLRAEQMTDLVACPTSGIQVIRHVGAGMSGQAVLADGRAAIDSLLLNRNSSGRSRGRCGSIEFNALLHRHHVTFLPGGNVIDLDLPTAHRVLGIYVPIGLMARMLADVGSGDLEPFHSERHDRLAQLMLMLETEIRTPGFASDMMVEGLMRAIVTILSRRDAGKVSGGDDRIYLSPRRLARVIELVESRLDGGISLGDMAREAGLSPYHFSRVFKLATGETPYQFIGSRRLERARKLLTTSDTPLAELALSCGYSSQSHFTAAFTHAMGLPPGRYRKLARS